MLNTVRPPVRFSALAVMVEPAMNSAQPLVLPKVRTFVVPVNLIWAFAEPVTVRS